MEHQHISDVALLIFGDHVDVLGLSVRVILEGNVFCAKIAGDKCFVGKEPVAVVQRKLQIITGSGDTDGSPTNLLRQTTNSAAVSSNAKNFFMG